MSEFLLTVIFSPILIFVVASIRLLRPIYIIRFGQLESEGIGHFSQPIEIYLSEIECGIHSNDSKIIDLWYLHGIVCNKELKNKWSSHLTIVPRLVKPIHILNKIIPGGKLHEIPYRRITNNNEPWHLIDIHGVLPKTKPIIYFTKKENDECIKLLGKAGFDITKKFVCLSVRDGFFHNDPDLASHRNSSVNEYLDAIDYLNNLGYQVVRIGAKVNEAINKKNPMIFDYAVNEIRSEILDLFIISKCTFLVGTGTGIEAIAAIFRKPQVKLNITELFYLSGNVYNTIIIIKKFISKDGKLIPLQEIYSKRYDRFSLSFQFKKANIKLVNNTKEEINAVLWEMHSRLNGNWKPDDQDEQLQTLFRSYWPNEPNRGKITARIGADFLRSNTELLQPDPQCN